jgi:hypothetical protein
LLMVGVASFLLVILKSTWHDVAVSREFTTIKWDEGMESEIRNWRPARIVSWNS